MNSSHITLEQSRPERYALDAALVVVGSLFIALCSQLSVPLPFTPVPFAMQNISVLLVATILGPRRGLMAVCAYLLEGAAGMPVFALGHSGLATLMGTSGGYLLAYLPASYIVGKLVENSRNWILTALAYTIGMLIVLLCGGLWLSSFLGIKAAWSLGIAPFIAVDLIKALMLTVAQPATHKAATWLP